MGTGRDTRAPRTSLPLHLLRDKPTDKELTGCGMRLVRRDMRLSSALRLVVFAGAPFN